MSIFVKPMPPSRYTLGRLMKALSIDVALGGEFFDDLAGVGLGIIAVNNQTGRRRRFVDILQARYVVSLSNRGLAIDPFGIASHANFERDIHVDFEESRDFVSRALAVSAPARRGVEDHRYALPDQHGSERNHLPVKCLAARDGIGLVDRENPAQNIGLEQGYVHAAVQKLRFQRGRDGGFAGSGQSCNPKRPGLLFGLDNF
jgi:hypothetical protein